MNHSRSLYRVKPGAAPHTMPVHVDNDEKGNPIYERRRFMPGGESFALRHPENEIAKFGDKFEKVGEAEKPGSKASKSKQSEESAIGAEA